jgi:hypothetical protein
MMHPLLRDPMRLSRLLCFALLLAPLSACGIDDSSTPAGNVVAGTYNLTSVDGQNLPFVQPSSGGQTAIVSGTFVANKDGSFSESRVIRTVSSGATQTLTTTGQLEIGGSVLTYTLTGGSSGLGSITTNQLTLQWAAGTFLYIRV